MGEQNSQNEQAADGPVELLLRDARVVNVFSGQVERGTLAIADGRVVGIGDYRSDAAAVDVGGRFIVPGFFDSHVHIESSMVSVGEFVRAVLPLGTTTVIADPHEIANVSGVAGVEYMLGAAENQPMNVFFMAPSCVPATPMETAGAVLDAQSLAPLLERERVLGLGEMMNFPGVLMGDRDVLAKIAAARRLGKPVDGHCPGLAGKDLARYAAAGISSDHECTTVEEAREKLAVGMSIMIREGTGAKNLDRLIPLISEVTAPFLMWCTDDRHPGDICREGHINYLLRRAVASGVDPITAIRMATINPAKRFGLNRLGAVAPGYRADLVVLPDLESFVPDQVYSGGVLVAEAGRMCPTVPVVRGGGCPSAITVDLDTLELAVPAAGKEIRVISLVPDQIVTRKGRAQVSHRDGVAVSDPTRDLLKLAVVERHRGTGNIGIGFVSGFGLARGAIASSVAHDSHNIICVGVEDADLRRAIEAVVWMGGGQAVVADGDVVASLPLPIAGLMSELPLETVRDLIEGVTAAAHRLGARPADPFMTLSFLALPVIPELKMTDRGLFDVSRFCHVPLFCGD